MKKSNRKSILKSISKSISKSIFSPKKSISKILILSIFFEKSISIFFHRKILIEINIGCSGQRKTIVKTAARSRAFFNIMSETGSVITDPQKDFVQFLKDITKAMVGNKGCEHGEILMKALSHFGMVRVPRDRVKQIFTGKRGRQYGVIREEFTLDDGTESHERFAYRVTKDYGNVFYKDYLKMVLGDDFTEVMGYADATAEKCGDVVEMWLGMLDLANMTKSQITFMETKADPGELLAGLEASINIFHGTTRSTTTPVDQESPSPRTMKKPW